MNYLASPPLVVAYALAGSMDADIVNDPLGQDPDGNDVYLRDLWPSTREVGETVERAVRSEMFRSSYAGVFDRRRALELARGADRRSLRLGRGVDLRPPAAVLRRHAGRARRRSPDIEGARVLARARRLRHDRPHLAGGLDPARRPGGAVPAGARRRSRATSTPTARGAATTRSWCAARSRTSACATSSRRAPRAASRASCPTDEQMSIYDASLAYLEEGTPLVVLAGKEYGSGSSRDWAAKGTRLLGVRAVLAESFERIHRSNLIGMGVLPLQLPASAQRARPDRRGGLLDHRPRRADERRLRVPTEVTRPRRRPSSSARACASTRPRRRTTSATAASCSTCCASCAIPPELRCNRVLSRHTIPAISPCVWKARGGQTVISDRRFPPHASLEGSDRRAARSRSTASSRSRQLLGLRA